MDYIRLGPQCVDSCPCARYWGTIRAHRYLCSSTVRILQWLVRKPRRRWGQSSEIRLRKPLFQFSSHYRCNHCSKVCKYPLASFAKYLLFHITNIEQVKLTTNSVVSTSTITGFANIAPQSLVKLDQRQDFTPSSTFYRQWFTPLSTSFYTSTYNPSPTPTPTPTPTAVSNLVQTGTDGKFTVFPSYIPETIPLHWPGCADRKHPIKVNQSLFTKQFSSVCSCRGIMPTTTTMPTAVSNSILSFGTRNWLWLDKHSDRSNPDDFALQAQGKTPQWNGGIYQVDYRQVQATEESIR
jgi:hypothetical protein